MCFGEKRWEKLVRLTDPSIDTGVALWRERHDPADCNEGLSV